MDDHADTWARIVEMVRARFPGDEPAVQALARATYDAEETVAYAFAQDTDDEVQVILDAALGAAQLRGEDMDLMVRHGGCAAGARGDPPRERSPRLGDQRRGAQRGQRRRVRQLR
jgi:hypothetical protein